MSAGARYLVTSGVFAVLAVGACSSSDLLVGDDARDAADGSVSDTSARPDSSPPVPPTDAATDAGEDAAPDVSCPELQQPPPTFCDGGPFAPLYSSNGCINGFACAPLLCVAAGGACVALSPGSCKTNHVGDATKYSCGGGLGVMCCLP